jgi:hypothetical protein
VVEWLRSVGEGEALYRRRGRGNPRPPEVASELGNGGGGEEDAASQRNGNVTALRLCPQVGLVLLCNCLDDQVMISTSGAIGSLGLN